MVDWPAHSDRVKQRYGDKLPMALRIRHLILTAISAADLLPGTRLIEADLGQQLAVSRTPLREALAGLKADGLLRYDEDGLRIRQLDWDDVTSLYGMRATLEAMAAGEAATRASAAEKNVINQICKDEQSMKQGAAQPDALAEINAQFHASILAAAGNIFLTESFERLSRLLILLGATTYSLPSRAKAIQREHDAINDAIQAGDRPAAEEAMKHHLGQALEARLIIMARNGMKAMD